MKTCAQCNKELNEEMVLPSGKTMHVAVIPFLMDGNEVILCGVECVRKYLLERCVDSDDVKA